MTPDKEEYIRRSEERRRQRIEREEAVSKAAAEMWSRMDRAKFGPLIEEAVRQAQLANQNTPNIHTYSALVAIQKVAALLDDAEEVNTRTGDAI